MCDRLGWLRDLRPRLGAKVEHIRVGLADILVVAPAEDDHQLTHERSAEVAARRHRRARGLELLPARARDRHHPSVAECLDAIGAAAHDERRARHREHDACMRCASGRRLAGHAAELPEGSVRNVEPDVIVENRPPVEGMSAAAEDGDARVALERVGRVEDARRRVAAHSRRFPRQVAWVKDVNVRNVVLFSSAAAIDKDSPAEQGGSVPVARHARRTAGRLDVAPFHASGNSSAQWGSGNFFPRRPRAHPEKSKRCPTIWAALFWRS